METKREPERGAAPSPSPASIVGRLREHLRLDGLGFLPGLTLPEDGPLARVGFSNGTLDTNWVRHFGGRRTAPNAAEVATSIHAALTRYASRPSARAADALEAVMQVPSARQVADAIHERIEGDPVVNRAVAHAAVRDIADRTASSEVLKLAIVLLGVVGDSSDNALFRLVGMHGDFTAISARAIELANRDPVPHLLDLAPATGGWGRVAIIETLLAHRTPAVREYLLTEALVGLSHELASEVAWSIATECDMLGMVTGSPTERQIRAVGATLATLAGSPFKDLGDYADAARACAVLLPKFEPFAASLHDYRLVAALHDRAAVDPGHRASLPWSDQERATVIDLSRRILDRDAWRAAVLEALEDPTRRYEVVRIADRLGIPYRDRLVGWIRQDPLRSYGWYLLCQEVDASTIDDILALAADVLDVGSIATGPADEVGLGPGFERDDCVGSILQVLRGRRGKPGFPGRGEDLLLAALRSRGIRNRRVSLRILEGWPKEWITPRLYEAIDLATGDPTEAVRQDAARLLQGLKRPPLQ